MVRSQNCAAVKASTLSYSASGLPPALPRRPRALPERQRLVAEHGLDDDVAGSGFVERVPVDQVAAFGDDLIGILHDLELLVAIVPMQPHALADHFENIDD